MYRTFGCKKIGLVVLLINEAKDPDSEGVFTGIVQQFEKFPVLRIRIRDPGSSAPF
jgi:hypothetical protein